MRVGRVEEKKLAPRSAEELRRRYKAGERDFIRTNLPGANLRRATLDGADLGRSNLRRADLSHADLTGANVAHAKLGGANFRSANLHRANLAGSDLSRAELREANLLHADCRDADFGGADLRAAILHGTSFAGANLTGSDFRGAGLHNARFPGARLAGTLLLDVDLTALCEADPPVQHAGPSTIDFRSIVWSVRATNLKRFLLRTGMPELFVDNLVDTACAVRTNVFMMRSTFISYGHPDLAFATKLYESLHSKNITTFFFPEHAIPGEKLHRTMKNGITEHDRVVLICSRASLDRKGVLIELEETLDREHRDGEHYLIPIRLDDYVLKDWAPKNPDIAQSVRDRVVADFEGADQDEDKFQAGLRKLIAALRK